MLETTATSLPCPTFPPRPMGNGHRRWLRWLAVLALVAGLLGWVYVEVRRASRFVGRVTLQVPASRLPAASEGDLAEQLKLSAAPETLLLVVQEKGLAQRWGLADASQAVSRLAAMVQPQQQGAGQFSIDVVSHDKAEAAELARAIGHAYEQRWRATEAERAAKEIARLEAALANQQKLVEEKRQIMLKSLAEQP